jgi:hypothetical protein
MVEWLGAGAGPPPLRTRIAATLLQERLSQPSPTARCSRLWKGHGRSKIMM